MDTLNLTLWTADVGAPADSAEAFADLIVHHTLKSWREGSDIVIFPEFTWMGLERFVTTEDKLTGVATLFETLWPSITQRLSVPDKVVVLGTVPSSKPDGALTNRAHILNQGKHLYQDKIHLTPWENRFTGGGPIHIWHFKGIRIAVVICLDVEIPDISVALRAAGGIDLMLVPSATESLLGVERVGRCADARSVELGCHVGLCHLTGMASSVLVDENIGLLAHFTPSQSPFLDEPRQRKSSLHKDGFHSLSVTLDFQALSMTRTLAEETNPANLRTAPITVQQLS